MGLSLCGTLAASHVLIILFSDSFYEIWQLMIVIGYLGLYSLVCLVSTDRTKGGHLVWWKGKKIYSELALRRWRDLIYLKSPSLCVSRYATVCYRRDWRKSNETLHVSMVLYHSQSSPALSFGKETGLWQPGANICLFSHLIWAEERRGHGLCIQQEDI